MRTRTLFLTGAAVVVFAITARAQDLATPRPVKMPQWDVNFSLGLFSNESRDEGDDYDGKTGHPEGRIDIGRYLTPHLKTELGITVPFDWSSSDYENFPVPGLPNGGYMFTDREMRLTILTPTLTYQFFENTFAHPYVSTGLRLGYLQAHSTREARTYTQNRISYAVPALDRKDSEWVVRPFVAAGFKSYFNQRTFLRTEGLIALGASGVNQVTLRAGFGVDF